MPRITKELSRKLILFAKSLQITANPWDAKATSAFEFYRQMKSPNLKKVNPNFTCKLIGIEEDKPPTISAEFLDGSKWNIESSAFTAADLRNDFYLRAADVEDNVDIVVPTEEAGKKDGKGKGKK